jgi:hypothetical protein
MTLDVEVVPAETFSFAESRDGLFECGYWSNGRHIVAKNGLCRCGCRFAVIRVPNTVDLPEVGLGR